MNETLQEFIDDVITKTEESITDKVFLMIQNDRDLFHRWLDQIQDRKRNYVNGEIAKQIKERFELKNKSRKNKPESFLIKSFQEFER